MNQNVTSVGRVRPRTRHRTTAPHGGGADNVCIQTALLRGDNHIPENRLGRKNAFRVPLKNNETNPIPDYLLNLKIHRAQMDGIYLNPVGRVRLRTRRAIAVNVGQEPS